MKKDKLNTEDGSEFTVFYLGGNPEKKSDFSSEPNKTGIHIYPEKKSDFSSEPNKSDIWEGTLDEKNHPYEMGENTIDEPAFDNWVDGWSSFSGFISPEEDVTLEKESDFLNEPNKQGDMETKLTASSNWEDIKKLLKQKKLNILTDSGKQKIKMMLKEDLANYLDKDILIDDTIKQDVISEPVNNEIYKIRGMNYVVRFLGYENDYLKVNTLISLPDKDVILYLNPKDELLIRMTENEKSYYENI